LALLTLAARKRLPRASEA